MPIRDADAEEEEKKEAEYNSLAEHQRLDQGWFKSVLNWVGKAELSHSRWNIGAINE